MPVLVNPHRFAAEAPLSYDADALAAFAAMTSAPSTARKNRIQELITGLKTDSIWTKIKLLGIFAAHHEQAARVDIKNPSRVGTATNSPTFTTDRGFTGDGATSDIDWGVGASTLLSLDDHSHYVWSITNASVTTRDAGNSSSLYINTRSSTNFQLRPSSSNTLSTSNSDGSGLLGYSRSGAAAVDAYRNGSSLATLSATSTALTSSNCTALRASTIYTTRQLAANIYAQFLTSTENANLYSRIRTYMTAVGVP